MPLVAVPPPKVKAKVVAVTEVLESVTVCVKAVPSICVSGVTEAMVGTPSLSIIVPVPEAVPIVSGTVSLPSATVSGVVATVTVKLVTPAGTLKMPADKVTPLLNTGAAKSPAEAVPPPRLNG